MSLVKRFEKNTKGRDIAVGDIHGYFTKLEIELERIKFNPEVDRLFSVGDLVDRGPESDKALEWLDKPWFHAVCGNHEDMTIRWPDGNMDSANYIANGGAWNVGNTPDVRRDFSEAFNVLPIAMEIKTERGLVGIVHADVPYQSWGVFIDVLEGHDKHERNHAIDLAMWNRSRINMYDLFGVGGIRAVIVGHTPLPEVVRLGNVIHIDTGGWINDDDWHSGFTLINLETLEII